MLVHGSDARGGTLLRRGTGLAAIAPAVLAAGAFAELTVRLRGPLALDGWNLTPVPFQLIGVAISIFLGFRNAACYERWWEARKLWGTLINTSRSLCRQWLTLLPDHAEVQAFQRAAVREVAGFAWALKAHLRTETENAVAAPFFEPETFDRFRGDVLPASILQHMGGRLRTAVDRGWVDTAVVRAFDASFTQLADILGGCERIKNTPVPLIYTAMTHRIEALYVLLLPFGLLTTTGELTPVVVMFVAFCLRGLDEVGNQLEDPFETDPNDLPLAALARRVEIDAMTALGEPAPRPLEPVDGVLL